MPERARLRVLLLTDEMEVGGTQRQIAHIARRLDPARFEVTVGFFRNRSFLADELEACGIAVAEIPKRGRIDPAFVRRLVAFLRAGRFDVMHCFAFTGELWGAVARALLPAAARPALITSVRNKYDWYARLQWRIKGWAARESCRVIANSHAGGEFARERMALAPGAVDVVYNGVEALPAAVPRATDAEHDAPTALFVGRLVEQKNVPVLLRATARLAAGGRRVRVRIAGDGPLRAACVAQVAALGLGGQVEMLGERSDVAALMAEADFVVQPSLREGLSNSILEAMMVGRPVIASAVGGSVELVEDGVTGLLFENDDDTALAAAMERLAGDRALRARMGDAARARALARFSIGAMVESMQGYYTECAARCGR
jgi:glycosyltransferase involved in cell wall biosynthesis